MRNRPIAPYERRLALKFWELTKGMDPARDWDFFEDNSVEATIRNIAIHWDEARVLVETLEDSHLDDAYSPEKRYKVAHFMDVTTRNIRLRDGTGDPYEVVRSEKTRAEILQRLTEIANDDFGDDPDEWRAWYRAFDEDPYFPPVR